MRSAQRCLDAKSFCHYVNDAYSPYEILHVIGFGQDHFLTWNEKGAERDEEGNGEKERIMIETWGKKSTREEEDRRVVRRRGRGSPPAFYLSFCFGENMFLIFEALEERPGKREIDYEKG